MTRIQRPRDLEADETTLFEAVQQHMARVVERVGACPDPQTLLDARAGRLPERDAGTILAHAATCPLCQALVETLAGPASQGLDTAAARRLDARIASATSTRSTGARVLPFPLSWRGRLAGALAAAAGLLFLVWPDTSIDPTALPAASRPPRTTPVRPPSVTVLRAERLPTSGMGLAAVSWRGDAEFVRPPWAFDSVRAAFDRGAFAEAESQLVAVTTSTPALGDAWLLLGVSRLLLGRAAEAIAPLERARALLVGDAKRDAAWHLAVAQHAAGHDAEARALLAPLCGDGGARASLACLALDELRAP
jgi:hypothetical protein